MFWWIRTLFSLGLSRPEPILAYHFESVTPQHIGAAARRCFVNPRLLKLIDTLSLPLDENGARRALRHFALEANFDFFAYLYLRGPESFAVSNYPTEWQLLYVEKDYIRIDPVVTIAKHGPPIFTWSATASSQRVAAVRYDNFLPLQLSLGSARACRFPFLSASRTEWFSRWHPASRRRLTSRRSIR